MPDADVPDTFEQYADRTVEPRFSEWLRASAGAAWYDMVDHRFVSEVAENELERGVFERYLLQEYAFVETSAATVGYAIGKAPSMAARRRLSDALSGLVGDQTDYFERAFDDLGVPRDRWADPPLTPATARFRDLVLRAATAGGYVEALTPMLAAEWLYATWCAEAAATVSAETYEGRWVSLHTAREFVEHAEWLRDQLDEYGPSLPAHRERRVRDLFERTLRCEVAFHHAPYDPDSEPGE